MEELGFLFGVLGNITVALVFLTPIGTFWKIVKNRSTEEFESFPYICMLLNASLWTYYGIIRPNSILVATINGFGVIVQTFYIVLFLLFAPPRVKVKTAALAVVMDGGFVVAAILVSRWAMEGEACINFVGFLCAGFNIISYASPLSAMRTVVTTKSVEFMPFFLSFFLCINGIIWTVYAILVRDYYVGVPNGVGIVLGAAQVVLYAIYRNAKPSDNAVGVLEEGWQHHQQPLIVPSD